MSQQENEQEGLILGIDYGLTYSTISYFDRKTKKPVLIKDSKGNCQFPSWINLSQLKKEEKIILGEEAMIEGINDYSIYDIKRMIGREYKDINPEERDNKWPFTVKNLEGPCIEYTDINDKDDIIYPEEICGIVLKYLVDIAIQQTGNKKIEKIIVTVPAEFNDNQRDAIYFSCQLALNGIETKNDSIFILNESTAVVTNYNKLVDEKEIYSLRDGAKVVIIDFGRATLNIDCCLYTKGKILVEYNG